MASQNCFGRNFGGLSTPHQKKDMAKKEILCSFQNVRIGQNLSGIGHRTELSSGARVEQEMCEENYFVSITGNSNGGDLRKNGFSLHKPGTEVPIVITIRDEEEVCTDFANGDFIYKNVNKDQKRLDGLMRGEMDPLDNRISPWMRVDADLIEERRIETMLANELALLTAGSQAENLTTLEEVKPVELITTGVESTSLEIQSSKDIIYAKPDPYPYPVISLSDIIREDETWEAGVEPVQSTSVLLSCNNVNCTYFGFSTDVQDDDPFHRRMAYMEQRPTIATFEAVMEEHMNFQTFLKELQTKKD